MEDNDIGDNVLSNENLVTILLKTYNMWIVCSTMQKKTNNSPLYNYTITPFMSHVTSLHNSDAFTQHSVPGDGDCLKLIAYSLLHNMQDIRNVEPN